MSRIVIWLALLSAVFSGFIYLQAKERWSKYGLYYLEGDAGQTALVISPDGRPIEPKANDPEAPTLPGFHVGSRRFKFIASHFSEREFSFRTERIEGTEYSFVGSFGHEDVEDIPDVPFLAGTLTEIRKGRLVTKKTVHFGHAVIL